MQNNKTSEALSLAEEIPKNIELSDIPLANTCLKAARLARLLNDKQRSDELIRISAFSGELEKESIPRGIPYSQQEFQGYKTHVYSYVINIYYELRFSAVPQEVFERTRRRVDNKLAEMVPEAVKKFMSIYDNMKSTNPEDWSNAVHSCRRILQAVADVLYPPNPDGLSEINRGGKKIKVGPDNYINRLVLYVEDKSNSERFSEVVGSHLKFIKDRLRSIYYAAQKGSHTEIKSAEEAERYIIYTYLLIGDILWLSEAMGTSV